VGRLHFADDWGGELGKNFRGKDFGGSLRILIK